MRDERRDEDTKPDAGGEKRPYHSPLLTEYGSVEDLVDGGVMGSVPTVPSVNPVLPVA
jgi:hypothetical protein